MKSSFNVFAFLAFLSLSGNCYGQELSDLFRYSESGEFQGNTEFGFLKVEYDWMYLGQNYSQNERSYSAIFQDFSYGLSERLSLGAAINYDFSDESTTTYGAATTVSGTKSITESDGIADPTISLRYRFFDTRDNNINMDIGVAYQPELVDAEYGTSRAKGNAGAGRSEISVDMRFGRKSESFEWVIAAGLENNGEASIESAEGGSPITTDSTTDVNFSYGAQWLLGDKIFFLLDIDLSYLEGNLVRYSDGSTLDYESTVLLGVTVGPKFVILEDKLVATLALSRIARGDRTVVDEDGVLINSEDYQGTMFGAALTYQF